MLPERGGALRSVRAAALLAKCFFATSFFLIFSPTSRHIFGRVMVVTI